MTDLATLLASVRCVLLDFDGPICSVFAGTPAAVVAERLRQHLGMRVDEFPHTVTRCRCSGTQGREGQRSPRLPNAS